MSFLSRAAASALLAGCCVALALPSTSAHAAIAARSEVSLAGEFGPAPSQPAAPVTGSALALAALAPHAEPDAGAALADEPPTLGGERARILLQSLTVPGWGQATLGRNTAAVVFASIEACIWTSFVAFKVQQSMRTDSYVRTARTFAGIDLSGRDESFRRTVGQYPSSDSYDLYVVYRDAANLWYGNPAEMDAYIQEHSLRGNDVWAWPTPESYTLYQEQRKQAQRAGLRANTALGLAVANRIVSALHAARYAGSPTGHAMHIEVGPSGDDLSGGRVALTTHF